MEDDAKRLEKNLEEAVKEVSITPTEKVPHEKIEPGLRTYASDIAEMMKREKGSIIKIALAEQKRRDEYKQKKDPTSTKNLIVIILGLILIVGGIMIFIYSIVNRAKPVNVTNISTTLPTLIFTENQAQIDMTTMNRAELINAIKSQLDNKTLALGTINNLFVSYKTTGGDIQVPSTIFLQKLGITAPNSLIQNLYPNFMLGVYSEGSGNNLFLIFKVKDFNDTFLAMREWESTMLGEFVRPFYIDTSAYGKTIFSKEFVTETLFNKEARLLKDSTGKVLLSYVFLDPGTVMITTQTDALQEVIKRLNLQTLK